MDFQSRSEIGISNDLDRHEREAGSITLLKLTTPPVEAADSQMLAAAERRHVQTALTPTPKTSPPELLFAKITHSARHIGTLPRK
jgi:hypothetical protein